MSLAERVRELFQNLEATTRRNLLWLLCLVLVLTAAYSLLAGTVQRLERTVAARSTTLQELLGLQQRYREAAAAAGRLTNRLAAVTPEDSPVTLVEQTGITGSGSMQVKPLPRQETGGMLRDSAEIRLQGLSLNELVNLLHLLEQQPKPVVVDKTVVRTRFSEPARLDLVLTLSLLRPGAAERR